jgi:hypothetical protein
MVAATVNGSYLLARHPLLHCRTAGRERVAPAVFCRYGVRRCRKRSGGIDRRAVVQRNRCKQCVAIVKRDTALWGSTAGRDRGSESNVLPDHGRIRSRCLCRSCG